MTDKSHDELAHSLAMHLSAPGRMVWEDLICGPSGNVRPDVLTMQKSFAKPNPMAYEVKISTSDFRSDVTKAKWHAYKKYAYGVTFACPMGLITKNDLPDGCGLMTFNGQSWRTVKKATLSPRQLDPDFLLKLLIDGNRLLSAPKPIQNRDFDHFKHQDTLRKKWGKDISEKLHFIEQYPKMRKEFKIMEQRLCSVLDVSSGQWSTPHNIKHAIKKLEKIADKDERKKLLISELSVLQKDIDRNINQAIKSLSPKIMEE